MVEMLIEMNVLLMLFQAVEPQPTVLLYNADGTLVHTPLVERGLADYDDETE